MQRLYFNNCSLSSNIYNILLCVIKKMNIQSIFYFMSVHIEVILDPPPPPPNPKKKKTQKNM